MFLCELAGPSHDLESVSLCLAALSQQAGSPCPGAGSGGAPALAPGEDLKLGALQPELGRWGIWVLRQSMYVSGEFPC